MCGNVLWPSYDCFESDFLLLFTLAGSRLAIVAIHGSENVSLEQVVENVIETRVGIGFWRLLWSALEVRQPGEVER